MKRGLYDEGYDKAAIADRIERAHKAARESGRGHHHLGCRGRLRQ